MVSFYGGNEGGSEDGSVRAVGLGEDDDVVGGHGFLDEGLLRRGGGSIKREAEESGGYREQSQRRRPDTSRRRSHRSGPAAAPRRSPTRLKIGWAPQNRWEIIY